MAEPLETWELILLSLVGLGVIFWMLPGVKRVMEDSERAPKDWAGVLLPIGAVVAFIVLLILTA